MPIIIRTVLSLFCSSLFVSPTMKCHLKLTMQYKDKGPFKCYVTHWGWAQRGVKFPDRKHYEVVWFNVAL